MRSVKVNFAIELPEGKTVDDLDPIYDALEELRKASKIYDYNMCEVVDHGSADTSWADHLRSKE